MPNKRETDHIAADAFEAKRHEREDAEAAHAAAVAAAEAKRAQLHSMRERSAAGDDSVSGLDLLSAEADLGILDRRAAKAQDDVQQARAEEASALADHWADRIADKIDPEAVAAAKEEAVAAITAALSRLVQHRDEVNALVADGVSRAQAVGIGYRTPGRLRIGHPDLTPGNRAPHLVVDGRQVVALPPNDALLDVLTEAVSRTGRVLGTAWGNVAVKDR